MFKTESQMLADIHSAGGEFYIRPWYDDKIKITLDIDNQSFVHIGYSIEFGLKTIYKAWINTLDNDSK